VLIDVRNMYETAIGRFQLPSAGSGSGARARVGEGSEAEVWAEETGSEAGVEGGRVRVLMYCTGGVRCERASAYLRSKGEDRGSVQEVYQLSGGIHAYQEAFPLGGFFAGEHYTL
ncbi:hypothetical protein B484DRAFT_331958, partial [Ochromonadaceae sp. CCMP2298]